MTSSPMPGAGSDTDPADSTLANVPPPPARTPVLRRIVLAVLTLVVLAGAAGFLGVRTGTVTASGDGYVISLEYAEIARGGLDVPFDVTLTHAVGFAGDMMTAAREEGIRRFSDVQLAVLESNGRISFFTRSTDDSSGAPDPPPPGTQADGA